MKRLTSRYNGNCKAEVCVQEHRGFDRGDSIFWDEEHGAWHADCWLVRDHVAPLDLDMAIEHLQSLLPPYSEVIIRQYPRLSKNTSEFLHTSGFLRGAPAPSAPAPSDPTLDALLDEEERMVRYQEMERAILIQLLDIKKRTQSERIKNDCNKTIDLLRAYRDKVVG